MKKFSVEDLFTPLMTNRTLILFYSSSVEIVKVTTISMWKRPNAVSINGRFIKYSKLKDRFSDVVYLLYCL